MILILPDCDMRMFSILRSVGRERGMCEYRRRERGEEIHEIHGIKELHEEKWNGSTMFSKTGKYSGVKEIQ